MSVNNNNQQPNNNINYLTVNVEDYWRPSRTDEPTTSTAMAAHGKIFSRSVSPCLPPAAETQKRKKRANSLTALCIAGNEEDQDEVYSLYTPSPSPSPSPIPEYLDHSYAAVKKHKKLYRRAHVTEMSPPSGMLLPPTPRPRCNTEPAAVLQTQYGDQLMVPVLRIPECSTTSGGALNRNGKSGSSRSVLGSLIKQTIKVTTASVGLRTPSSSVERLTQLATNESLSENAKRRQYSRSANSVNANAAGGSNTNAAAATTTTSMAALPSIENSATALNLYSEQQQQQLQQLRQVQHQKRLQYCQQTSLPESYQSGDSTTSTSTREPTTPAKNDSKSLRHSSFTNSLNPLVSVQSSSSIRGSNASGLSSGAGGTTTSLTSANSGAGNNTAKQHDQQTAAVAAISTTSNAAAGAAAAAAAGSVGAVTTTPTGGKEKKRKEVSSSRVKKFHRHFTQVSKDEKLINYFSCALVSDILLQGHLYITDQHFAFYSNVFGYVTKVVIPTSSVTKISKEKTAKIIPNAVGVATADERHVFGSFISRESAFRLMCSVCPPLAPIELLPKVTTADIEISEEYSIEDDSSCSISGNESPPQALDAAAAAVGSGIGGDGGVAVIAGEGQLLIRRSVANASSSSDKLLRHSGSSNNNNSNNLNVDTHASIGMRSSAPPGVNFDQQNDTVTLINGTGDDATIFASSSVTKIGLIIAGSISSSTSNVSGSSSGPSTSSSPTTVVGNAATTTATTTATASATTTTAATTTTTNTPKNYAQIIYENLRSLLNDLVERVQQRSELHMLYIGIMLAVLLALFSVFLLYRILDIEAKTKLYNSPVDFNWRSGNDEDIFAEALRWQRELQAKTTEEAQTILTKNLEQISKVRRSLETLSMLIHDRSTAYGNPTNRDDSD